MFKRNRIEDGEFELNWRREDLGVDWEGGNINAVAIGLNVLVRCWFREILGYKLRLTMGQGFDMERTSGVLMGWDQVVGNDILYQDEAARRKTREGPCS